MTDCLGKDRGAARGLKRRRLAFVCTRLLVVSLVSILGGRALADDRRMKAAEGDSDARITEGQLRHGDLLGAGDREDDTEAKVQAHLEAARKFLDVDAYDAAMLEIDAADRLVPFHEDVMALLEIVGDLRDTARKFGMALTEIEEERRARDARAEMEREEKARRARAADEVIARHNLPRGLEHAVVALLDRQQMLADRRGEARLARERCIGAAARVHAHGAGRQCREEESALAEMRREEREVDADLAVLTAAFRERHGQQALDRLLREAGRD